MCDQTEHTHGPIEIVPCDIDGAFLLYDGPYHEGHIAEIHGTNAEANAKFFAAAPEMRKLLNISLAALRSPEAIDRHGLANDIERLLARL